MTEESDALDRDFDPWLTRQARHLPHRELPAAAATEAPGAAAFNKLAGNLRLLLLHMLKCDHQPPLRSWWLSIDEQRLEVADVLLDHPGLRPRLSEAIARAYRKARREAAKETGLAEAAFPPACPYSFDDIRLRSFSP